MITHYHIYILNPYCLQHIPMSFLYLYMVLLNIMLEIVIFMLETRVVLMNLDKALMYVIIWELTQK